MYYTDVHCHDDIMILHSYVSVHVGVGGCVHACVCCVLISPTGLFVEQLVCRRQRSDSTSNDAEHEGHTNVPW